VPQPSGRAEPGYFFLAVTSEAKASFARPPGRGRPGLRGLC